MATGVRVRDPIVRGGADAGTGTDADTGTDVDTGTGTGAGAGTGKRSRGELDHDVARSMPSHIAAVVRDGQATVLPCPRQRALDARVAWSAFIQRAG